MLTKEIMSHTDRATTVKLTICGARSGEAATVGQDGLNIGPAAFRTTFV